jgi:3-oxocholest-4-en-26-oyl-CoA dehydrogenase alpha subunit
MPSGGRIHVGYTPEQERLRQELRGYFGRLMTPEICASLVAADDDYGNG